MIELRYDASLFGGKGEPSADPAALTVGHADGPDADYDPVPPCLGRGAMPLEATACVDLDASRIDDDGGVVHRGPHPRHEPVDRVLIAQPVNQRPSRVPSSSTRECRDRGTSTGGPSVMRRCRPETMRGT